MPPKAFPILQPPSPVIPTEINDDHDILCVLDLVDTLDSIPGELTQRFGDLRELDAVLNATTVHLTSRLKALTDILNEAVDMASTPVSAPLTNPDKPTRSNDVENISGQEVDTEPSLPGPSSSSPTPKEAESAITPDLNTAVPTATTPGPVQTQSWDRFQILLEIAEELSRFKVGVEDKVKVAGNACDHVIQHQTHISQLLSQSTILLPPLPSSSTLPQTQKRSKNSPLPPRTNHNLSTASVNASYGTGAAYQSASTTGLGGQETPGRKKRKAGSRLGGGGWDEEWDEEVRSPGRKDKKGGAKKKVGARASSVASSSIPGDQYSYAQPGGKGIGSSQLASGIDDVGVKRANANHSHTTTPAAGGGGNKSSHAANNTGSGSNSTGATGTGGKKNGKKTSANTVADDGQGWETGAVSRGGSKRTTSSNTNQAGATAAGKKDKSGTGANYYPGYSELDLAEGMELDHEAEGEVDGEAPMEEEADTALYCYCQKTSFGEMIGCDSDHCEYEWFHLSCLRLERPPDGAWLCPDCTLKAEQNKKKRGGKGGASRKSTK